MPPKKDKSPQKDAKKSSVTEGDGKPDSGDVGDGSTQSVSEDQPHRPIEDLVERSVKRAIEAATQDFNKTLQIEIQKIQLAIKSAVDAVTADFRLMMDQRISPWKKESGFSNRTFRLQKARLVTIFKPSILCPRTSRSSTVR